MKAAAAEVDEKWLQWKANHLDMLVQQNKNGIAAQVREKGIDYFISTGERLGLRIMCNDTTVNSTCTPKILGRKHTVSGSLPRQRSITPTERNASPLEQSIASPTTPWG